MKAKSQRRKVVVAFPNTRISRVEKMSGIFRFLQGKNNWDITMRQAPLKPKELKDFDGVLLTGTASADSLAAIEKCAIPAVLIAMDCNRSHDIAIVNTDAAAIGRQVALRFLAGGIYKTYACLHPDVPTGFSMKCEEAFAKELAKNGAICTKLRRGIGEAAAKRKPVAIFAFNDDLASRAISECKSLGLNIPDDIAIMGFGNDTMMCENHHPTISSVEPDFAKQGYLAAMHLERMMSSRSPCRRTEESVGIKRIVFRESTHRQHGSESLVRRAMVFINTNCRLPIDVRDVVAHLGSSRRLAEIRFREVRKETILNAIRNARLDATKAELLSSDDSIARVCERCGWKSENAPKKLFKLRFGTTMRECRNGKCLNLKHSIISAKIKPSKITR
jgi:LacI family transcriptional regulator